MRVCRPQGTRASYSYFYTFGSENGRTLAEPGRGEAGGREGVLTEASGRTTPENVDECAETGDIVSKGSLIYGSN